MVSANAARAKRLDDHQGSGWVDGVIGPTVAEEGGSEAASRAGEAA
jgi:hypothetical protein